MMICILLDQIVKYIVVQNMQLASSIHIIRNFFRITYVENTGAAWSILSGNRIFLILISIIVLGFFLYYLLKKETINKTESIVYGILVGGILGNLIDRIHYGYVIDFLDFNFLSYSFPVFNIADMCIVISGILLIIKVWKEEKK